MRIGIDQLRISPLRPSGIALPSPGMRLVDRARLSGLETLPAIKVRPDSGAGYEILSGLITWRVAQMLNIHDVDVACLHVDDAVAREMVHGDMEQGGAPDPITRAEMLSDQIKVEGLSRNTICRRYGLSKSQLSHMLRLLQLDPQVREQVRAGRLSTGMAKVLVNLPPKTQQQIAQKAIEDSLSVRQVEGLARNAKTAESMTSTSLGTHSKDSNTHHLETELSEQLGSPVTIDWDRSRHSGEIAIRYFSLEELQSIIERLRGDRAEWGG